MSSYVNVIKRESKPYIESIKDDIEARKDKDFFWPTGTQVYCGKQGSGKTISAVYHLMKLKTRYPKAIIVSNLKLSKLTPVPFDNKEQLENRLKMMSTDRFYVYFQTLDQLGIALTNVNNGRMGVIYVIDEIHTYFNALDSKTSQCTYLRKFHNKESNVN